MSGPTEDILKPQAAGILDVIHHIQPLEYGGSNDFDNGVPVTRPDHQLFNNSLEECPKYPDRC